MSKTPASLILGKTDPGDAAHSAAGMLRGAGSSAAPGGAAATPRTAVAALPPSRVDHRGEVRGEHQAIVVVERRFARSGDSKSEQTIPGWQWTLGNARIGQLYDRLFADAHLTWSSLVVPEEQEATFADLQAPMAAQQAVLPYNGDLLLRKTSLTATPEQGESLYLIFNGHHFPICDLNDAVQVHRQNRCDATLIDFPKIKRNGYEENFQIDDDGRVKRVNRNYGADGSASLQVERDWPIIIVLSGDAMKAMLDVSLPQRINQWPLAMLRAGLLVRGSTIPGRSFSLHDRDHLYELNEGILRLKPQWLAEAGGLVDQGEKIWVGKNVRIASSANLLGPVAIGDNVEIGSDAVIVGPTTIGHGSKIGAGVVLKRSVVLPNTTVAGATMQTHSLSNASTLGGDQPTLQALTRDSLSGESYQMAGGSSPHSLARPIRLEKVLEAGVVPALSGVRYHAFRIVKRFIDICGSLVALSFSLPLYPIIGALIKINSPGPIFYGHYRQGRGGKSFRVWKFRTMVVNAEEIKRKLLLRNEVDGPQFKIKDDPRIFAVGKWLRRLNLDEIPQFVNVLIGQMSLVGPRPSPEKENQMCPAWREARLTVRPGITGLWQVMRLRDRGETDFQEWIYYDIQYIKRQSIWLDVKILFRTIGVAAGGGQ